LRGTKQSHRPKADEFIKISSLDDSTLDLDETSDDYPNISPPVEAYLKRVGRVPLLKPEEEKALFEILHIQKKLLGKILSQLQDCNLLDSEQQEQLKQVFRFKRRRANKSATLSFKDGQMKFSPEILGRLQDLIADWRDDAAIGFPNKRDGYFSVLEPKAKTIKYEESYEGKNNFYQTAKSNGGFGSKIPHAPSAERDSAKRDLCEKEDAKPRLRLSAEFEAMFTELQTVVERIQDIQRRLVEANLLLVASIAKNFVFHESPLSFLDLIQEGSIGLMRAIHKFRLEKGCRFATYATWWISQAVRRAIDEQSQLIRVPVYITEVRRRAARASIDLTKRLGRKPQMSELAEAVKITKSRLHNILQAPKDLLSLDSPIEGSDNGTTVADLIQDKVTMSPEEAILSQARREAMADLLSTLSPQQSHVIILRYGLFDGKDRTLAQVGEQLQISRERVRQIETEALRKLRHSDRQHYWEELVE